ncbi:exodeoxyribonuclease VII large subunit [Demequina muriae]|uniref:Exodeoxyribonuclease 7 large subunit n=1 Tax=Demequina muriae TaxID=3051664 RepID=A0ABT8GF06_9MICO|nr:exodeoxyribonuclease VII large subunit [Demequina sp. EGI L300058]MDN4480023.1 exodeoxyribonuclease VII large subunit [Demequina sp. EGI L300058]
MTDGSLSPDNAPQGASASGRGPAGLPGTAADTTAERPWPVHHLTGKIGQYVHRMGPVWVEGQVLRPSRWKNLVFFDLRDPSENATLGVSALAAVVDRMGTPLDDGSRVVLQARPRWWARSGALKLDAADIRHAGVGDLLAQIEALKEALAAEGLFDADRKRPLPFVPRRVGLVCATQGEAEHDVVVNATKRWPSVTFEIRRVSVQGQHAVREVSQAIEELDAIADIDVIVVARGGGSFEDLIAFSDERVVRAAAACETPLVSAIGHEKDSPVLDLVADYRASTPTDAGKRIVPDAVQERAGVDQARRDMRAALESLVAREARGLDQFRSRPVLAHPHRMLDPYRESVARARTSAGRALVAILAGADSATRELGAALRALSPQGTLDRGYAIARDAAGSVIRDAATLTSGDAVHLRFAAGEADASVTSVSPSTIA